MKRWILVLLLLVPFIMAPKPPDVGKPENPSPPPTIPAPVPLPPQAPTEPGNPPNKQPAQKEDKRGNGGAWGDVDIFIGIGMEF